MGKRKAVVQASPLRRSSRVAKGVTTTAQEHAIEVTEEEISKKPRNSKRAKVEAPALEEEEEATVTVNTKTIVETKEESVVPAQEPQDDSAVVEELKPARKQRTTSKKIKPAASEDELEVKKDSKSEKTRAGRKSKEQKEAEAMPLAARTSGLKMFVGAHVSAAKGVQNSVTNSVHIGGNAFALFLKSHRKWESPPLLAENKNLFKSFCEEHGYNQEKHVVPHASYLVNLAQVEPEKSKQALDCFIDDLKRCDALGIRLYNFHPGNTVGEPRPEALSRIAASLNKAHAATESVITLLENMAGQNNVIGSNFEDLRDIIAEVEDKSRVGVCLDTCHTFAAGYDLRTAVAFQATMAKFDSVVGLSYLKALHLNDSKAPLGSHRDLHQNIGLGFLGLRSFHSVMNFPPFENLPMVLETPIDVENAQGKMEEDQGIWAREIKILESLIGMDTKSADFLMLEAELNAKGAVERGKHQEAHNRKLQKGRVALEKGPKKTRTKKEDA
ncbi:MAG: hypothetical protein M1829_003561 [Trizodia sp. TS-e1964]|nr:MAG: hypothetical protein M1829_003561 [Trizodia sp. TS-e1964]